MTFGTFFGRRIGREEREVLVRQRVAHQSRFHPVVHGRARLRGVADELLLQQVLVERVASTSKAAARVQPVVEIAVFAVEALRPPLHVGAAVLGPARVELLEDTVGRGLVRSVARLPR